MRNIKFYISMVMVIGLFISLNSTSFAGERYNIDVDSVKKAAKSSSWGNQAEIEWNAKITNKTDESQNYEVKVNFLDSNNNKIEETTKITSISPNGTKIVTQQMNISAANFKAIDSGYITISKIEEQTLTAKLEKYMDMMTNKNSDGSIELSYSVKLRNNTDKAMIRNITVAFLDANNNHVKSETVKTSFDAGEAKLIKDTLELSAYDAARIATSHVTIN